MKCPKCSREIPDNTTVCPHCKKVLSIECPNCHSLNTSTVCEKCGYLLLTKCSKCGKTVSTSQSKCKCGFPIETSIAYQECETDEFASIIIKFLSLKNIRRLLGSQELFSKFFFRLKNLLVAQIGKTDGSFIMYNDTFVLNFNKELSFPTSANKATRLALKIINAFSELNQNVINELGTPLNLNISIIKKDSEKLLECTTYDSNVKLLSVKKDQKKYLKGMQVILDEFVCDCISKEYKVDSLYTIEKDNIPLTFYEVVLDKYVLPPSERNNDSTTEIQQHKIIKEASEENKTINDIYDFKIFDINAKCKFEKINALSIIEKLECNKIISIRSEKELQIQTSDIVNYFESKGIQTLYVSCTQEMNYRPWGVLTELFKDYYNLPLTKDSIPADFKVPAFNKLIDLVKSIPRKATTAEDARFAYMEDFESFLTSLKNCTIIIENFEYIDETTIQTLELYFDKYKRINTHFIFTTDHNTAIHNKIKSLLRTSCYTELTVEKVCMESILSSIKEEATDFIQSFYFEKIKENFKGSVLYFKNAIQYLKDLNILVSFENKLLLKNSSSVVLPNNISDLLKARLKSLSKNMDASMILAYSNYLGARLDIETLAKLGIKDIKTAIKTLVSMDFIRYKKGIVYINNYNILKPVIETSLKSQVNEFLAKNILGNLGKGIDDTTLLLIMGKISLFKEEYLLLWKNSQLAMNTGDYDAYLKNCLGFLSLIKYIENNIAPEDIENNKKEVYQNILLNLYNYAPEKIFDIENILLIDAMNKNDNDKIVKLSNLMLQGALITSNYADAYTLVHNILSRIPTPTLIVNESINTKFLLLSLVNIEILFNIGEYTECVDTTKDLLKVIKPDIIEKIKPNSFSTNLFIQHMQETFRLSALAKMFLMDDELEDFLEMIKESLGEDLAEKNCILDIVTFLNNKEYTTSGIETSSPFAKIIYLILQEFQTHNEDYKNFAQNIYQAKLLAIDIHQTQLELLCDLLIAYSYAQMGITQKAEYIYNDILTKAEKSAIFNIQTLAQYLLAKLYIVQNKQEEAIQIINDALALLQKYNNQAKIIYVLLEQLFIQTLKDMEISSIDIQSEEQKINQITSTGKLLRLI